IRFFNNVFRHLKNIPSKEEVKFNFSEGIKLALTGVITTILLTCDRFVINHLKIPVELKGTFQLADYLGMAVYMVFTTVIFYFYSKWIQKIRDDKHFANKYLTYCGYSIFLSPIILLIIY